MEHEPETDSSRGWRDLQGKVKGQRERITIPFLVSVFEDLEQMPRKVPQPVLCDFLEIATMKLETGRLADVGKILHSCGRIGLDNLQVVEKLCGEIVANVDVRAAATRDLTGLMLGLGKVYERFDLAAVGELTVESRFGENQPCEASCDMDIVEGARDGLVSLGMAISSCQCVQQTVSKTVVDVGDSNGFNDVKAIAADSGREGNCAGGEGCISDRYSMITGICHLKGYTDYLLYEREGATEEIELSSKHEAPEGRQYKDSLELVRLLATELLVRPRPSALTPKDLYRSIYGLSLLRYKRDSVLLKLTQRLRLPEYHSRLSIKELSDIIEGLGILRFRHHRALRNICWNLLTAERQSQLDVSDTVRLLQGMARLGIYDEQLITTLGLRLRWSENIAKMTGGQLVTTLCVFASAKMRDAPVLTTIAKELSKPTKFSTISDQELVDLVSGISKLRVPVVPLVDLLIVELSNHDRVQKFQPHQWAEVMKASMMFGGVDAGPMCVILEEIVKSDCLQAFTEKDLVSVLQGLAQVWMDGNQEVLVPIFMEALREDRLASYNQREICTVVWSLGKMRCPLAAEMDALWQEILNPERTRKFRAGMVADMLEGLSHLEEWDEQVVEALLTVVTTPSRMDFTTMQQFVSILHSLARMGYRGYGFLGTLMKQFVRPNQLRDFNPRGLPVIVKAILDLKLYETRRVNFLAMHIRHHPGFVSLWSDNELKTVWQGLKVLHCEDVDVMSAVRKEMRFRGLSCSPPSKFQSSGPANTASSWTAVGRGDTPQGTCRSSPSKPGAESSQWKHSGEIAVRMEKAVVAARTD
eukprot:evm.model.scf_277.6 EVM.evm.TU.scf_277.6   scf_277:38653-42872(-)